ncbi:MAG: hypothetical protein CSA20_09090 [Deltaproteobacteria bacterium]|nr:MAG: hypothetical protein CSA20_09090 [Deltaproteobacteria bacterium]
MLQKDKRKDILDIFFLFFFVALSGANTTFAHAESWEKHFVENEEEIPTNKFRAFYFNEQTSGILRHTEIVDRPVINFVRNDFYNIDAEYFGAYWIGYLEFEKETTMTISVYQSRSESKIFINGKNVFSDEDLTESKEKDYTFEPGKHKVEIQYISNYSSASFLVNIHPQIAEYNEASLRETLNTISNPEILYCGAYESDNFDMSVEVNLKHSDRKKVLFLSSYQPIIWKIKNANSSNIATVIVSSHGKESTVEGLSDETNLIYYRNIPSVYKIKPKRSSSASKNNFKNLAYIIQDLTGYKPNGFSGGYGLKSISVPETVLDKKLYSQFGLKFSKAKTFTGKSTKSRLDKVFE